MYLTHAVRTIRDDPTEGVEVTLVVRLPEDVDPETVVDAVGDVGEYAGATTFDDARLRVPEPAVTTVLNRLPAATEAVETDAVTGIGGDAGEDL